MQQELHTRRTFAFFEMSFGKAPSLTGIEDLDEYIMAFLRPCYDCTELAFYGNLWDLIPAMKEATTCELEDALCCMLRHNEWMVEYFKETYYTDFVVFVAAIKTRNLFVVDEYFYKVNNVEKLMGAWTAFEHGDNLTAHWIFENVEY